MDGIHIRFQRAPHPPNNIPIRPLFTAGFLVLPYDPASIAISLWVLWDIYRLDYSWKLYKKVIQTPPERYDAASAAFLRSAKRKVGRRPLLIIVNAIYLGSCHVGMYTFNTALMTAVLFLFSVWMMWRVDGNARCWDRMIELTKELKDGAVREQEGNAGSDSDELEG